MKKFQMAVVAVIVGFSMVSMGADKKKNIVVPGTAPAKQYSCPVVNATWEMDTTDSGSTNWKKDWGLKKTTSKATSNKASSKDGVVVCDYGGMSATSTANCIGYKKGGPAKFSCTQDM